MKTRYLLGAIALLAVSCTKAEQPVIEPSSECGLTVTATTEQPGDATKTSLDGLAVKWTAGDEIVIYDLNCKRAIYKALTSASSTSFEYVSGDEDLSGDVYAYYPAGNVTAFDPSNHSFTATLPSTQPYSAGGFADGINPMTAKATVVNGGVSLSFKNLLSFVKVQITDSVSDKTIFGISLSSSTADLCGEATVTVGDGGTAATSITGGGSKSIEISNAYGSLSTVPFPVYVAVPVGDLGKLTITAKTSETTGSFSQTKVSSKDLTAVRSNIYVYNPMDISNFNGKTVIPQPAANCYMVTSGTTVISIPLSQAIAGWNAIKALETGDTFDPDNIISGTRTIDVRWLDGTGTITLSEITAEALTLSLSGCPAGGNAVVDLKNESDIVWSWHLWFTDYIPGSDNDHTKAGQVHTYSGAAFQNGGKYYGKVMMDRNLGATATGVSGAISQPQTADAARTFYGLYYQFGRKEPFSNSVEPTKVRVTSSKVTYAYAAQHPTEYYYTTKSGDSWCSTDIARTDENMTDPWNSASDIKSAFDPCPAGWRLPVNGTTITSNVWVGMTTSTWQPAYNSITQTCGQLWCGAWFPAAGFRSHGGGSLDYYGKTIFYWGAPRTAGAGYYAMFSSGTVDRATDGNGSRAYGLPVRCVQE